MHLVRSIKYLHIPMNFFLETKYTLFNPIRLIICNHTTTKIGCSFHLAIFLILAKWQSCELLPPLQLSSAAIHHPQVHLTNRSPNFVGPRSQIFANRLKLHLSYRKEKKIQELTSEWFFAPTFLFHSQRLFQFLFY